MRLVSTLLAAAGILTLLSEAALVVVGALTHMAFTLLAWSTLANGLFAAALVYCAIQRLRRRSWEVGMMYIMAVLLLGLIRVLSALQWCGLALHADPAMTDYSGTFEFTDLWRGAARLALIAAGLNSLAVLLLLAVMPAVMTVAAERKPGGHRRTNNAARPPVA